MAERGLPPHEHVDGSRRCAGRVLGLRARQLAEHASVPEGVAQPLPGGGSARDRRAHAGVLVRPRPRHRGARRRAARDPVRGGARPRLPAMARVREQGVARPLPVRSHGKVGATALRRGRVRGHRARDRRGARHRGGADEAAPARGRAGRPAGAADGGHRAARGPRPARAGARLDGGRGLDRGRRRRCGRHLQLQRGRGVRRAVRGRRRAGALRGGRDDRGGVAGAPLHGVQFTPAPPGPS